MEARRSKATPRSSIRARPSWHNREEPGELQATIACQHPSQLRLSAQTFAEVHNVSGLIQVSGREHLCAASHPSVQGNVNEVLIRCFEKCYPCAQTCVSCSGAWLAEDMVDKLRQYIRLNQDCADLCPAAGSVGIRRTGSNEQVIVAAMHACAAACRACAEECEKHAIKHEHCRICAEHCRLCEQACDEAASSIQ